MDEKEALLSQLKSVHLPEVSAVPAIGWWVLSALMIAMVIIALWFRKRYLSRLWQREATQELFRIREQSRHREVSATLADTSRLARRILLRVKPRESVASLHGRDWLVALDELCERPLFANGFGRLLESGQYQRDPKVNPADMDSLLDAMEELIRSSGKRIRPAPSSIDAARQAA